MWLDTARKERRSQWQPFTAAAALPSWSQKKEEETVDTGIGDFVGKTSEGEQERLSHLQS